MTTGESGKNMRRKLWAAPLWVRPLWALAAVLCVSMADLLLFTSDAGSRVIVVNDTSVRPHVFECYNAACTQGVSGDDSILHPGKNSPVLGTASDGTGLVGEATSPGDRLIGCLSARHVGQDVPLSHAVLASSLRSCPGRGPGRTPVVIMVSP
jgi:hypothetical protein